MGWEDGHDLKGLSSEVGAQSQLSLRKKWVIYPEIEIVKSLVSEVC